MLTLKTDCVLLTQMEYDDLLASAKRQPCGVMGCHEDAGTKTARITKDDLTYVIDLCDRHWEDGDVTFKITAALGGVDLHGATPRGAARRRFRP